MYSLARARISRLSMSLCLSGCLFCSKRQVNVSVSNLLVYFVRSQSIRVSVSQDLTFKWVGCPGSPPQLLGCGFLDLDSSIWDLVEFRVLVLVGVVVCRWGLVYQRLVWNLCLGFWSPDPGCRSRHWVCWIWVQGLSFWNLQSMDGSINVVLIKT